MATDIPRYRLGPCPECHLGALQPGHVFFCSRLGDTLITVPDFPAWICDVCGRREYDAASVLELQALLQMERGQRAQRRRAAMVRGLAASTARASASGKRG